MGMRRILRGAAVAAGIASALVTTAASAAPTVWVVDDGRKLRADGPPPAESEGIDNPVWSPGNGVRLFAMRSETVALQVVVEAGAEDVTNVAVDLDALDGPDGARLVNGTGAAAHAEGRPFERFVERFPTGVDWADTLVPVERPTHWQPYPTRAAAHQRAVVWIDLGVPRTQAPGSYRGALSVHWGSDGAASVPVELEVAPLTLPDRPVVAATHVDVAALEGKRGRGVEGGLYQMLHAHRVEAVHDLVRADDVSRQEASLDGSLFLPARHYAGAGASIGDAVVVLGAGGAFQEADERLLPTIEGIADALRDAHAFGGRDVFLDTCRAAPESTRDAGAWTRLLATSTHDSVKRVRVAGCPADPVATTSTFAPDADAIAPRTVGWLQRLRGVPVVIGPDLTTWDDDAAPGDRVMPTVRLDAWRRGVEDAGYLQLAREKDPARADAIVTELRPSEADLVSTVVTARGSRSLSYFEARRALLAVALGR